MALLVLSRRTITFRQPGRGEVTVLVVPGRDQIQVMKDIGSAAAVIREPGAKAARLQKQLARVSMGQRYVYGSLPEEITEMRQPVKVWLAEDFAPANCQGFFFVFSSTVVIHGVREQSDEGQISWRTAQLSLSETDPLTSIIDAISDFALANSTETLTVAVLNQLDLYEKLQTGLATYGISPVPFSKLKPMATMRPLYRHLDYTIFYLTLVLFGFIVLLASGGYLFLNVTKRNSLQTQIDDVQREIDQIKMDNHQSVGQIADPQAVLDSMGRSMPQLPSAVLDAAASAGSEFGELVSLRFAPAEGPNEQEVTLMVQRAKDALLLDEERRAQRLLTQRPWVRSIKRNGQVGEQASLAIGLQISQAPSATAVMVEQSRQPVEIIKAAPQPLDASATVTVSETTPVSATAISGTTVPPTAVSGTVVPSVTTPNAAGAK